jgi:hypothetical protein
MDRLRQKTLADRAMIHVSMSILPARRLEVTSGKCQQLVVAQAPLLAATRDVRRLEAVTR